MQPPDHIYKSYISALKCYTYLKKNTNCLLLRYEDLSEKNPLPLHKLSDFLGARILEDHQFNYGKNSQEGSLVKSMRDEGVVEPSTLKAIQTMWEAIGPSVLRDFPEFAYDQ
jgi:hypothetical protein